MPLRDDDLPGLGHVALRHEAVYREYQGAEENEMKQWFLEHSAQGVYQMGDV